MKVPAGRYTVNLELTRPVTLLAMGQAVLDGVHSGSVVRVSLPDSAALVRLSGFTIVGGNAPEAGGAVSLVSGSLELIDCTLRFNKAPLYGGGGLFVGDGKAKISRCRFEANTGRQGGAILVDGVGELRLEDSTVIQNAAVEGGGIKVKEGAKVEVLGCTLADNKVVGDGANGGALHCMGTTTRAPTVSVTNSIISERSEGAACVFNHPKLPAGLTVSRSLLPTWCKSLGGAGNKFADAGFVMSGSEPYLLSDASPAVGAGDSAAFGNGSKDVTGRVRARGGMTDLGAFAFVQKSTSNVGY
ncbi:MAG: right-handed parallel beta-helix repeat-containing protein [Archangium sp.]|nr:right-handed parallel beta-helix repeat-containing protein [Archangium sp.]